MVGVGDRGIVKYLTFEVGDDLLLGSVGGVDEVVDMKVGVEIEGGWEGLNGCEGFVGVYVVEGERLRDDVGVE